MEINGSLFERLGEQVGGLYETEQVVEVILGDWEVHILAGLNFLNRFAGGGSNIQPNNLGARSGHRFNGHITKAEDLVNDNFLNRS